MWLQKEPASLVHVVACGPAGTWKGRNQTVPGKDDRVSV